MFQLPCDSGNRGDCSECTQPDRTDAMCRAMCSGSHLCQRARPTHNYEYYQAMCEQHGEAYQAMWSAAPRSVREVITVLVNPTTFPLYTWPSVLNALDIGLDDAIRAMLSPLGFWCLDAGQFAMVIGLGALAILGSNIFNPLLPLKTEFTYVYMADYLGEMIPWLMSGDDSDLKWERVNVLFANGFQLGFTEHFALLEPPSDGWAEDWRDHLESWIEKHREYDCRERVEQLLETVRAVLEGARDANRLSFGAQEDVVRAMEEMLT